MSDRKTAWSADNRNVISLQPRGSSYEVSGDAGKDGTTRRYNIGDLGMATMMKGRKFQAVNTKKKKGLVSRLEQIKKKGEKFMDAKGFPKRNPCDMQVLPATTLRSLKRIPRSSENKTLSALEVMKNAKEVGGERYPNAMIIFFSHNWTRKSFCSSHKEDIEYESPKFNQECKPLHHQVGFPDDEQNSKAMDLIEYIEWYAANVKEFKDVLHIHGARDPLYISKLENIYIWIDYCSIDQDDDEIKAMQMECLPAFLAASTHVFKYDDRNMVYDTRGWCRVESAMASGFSPTGALIHTVRENFRKNRVRSMTYEWRKTLDPAKGEFTNPGDKVAALKLGKLAAGSKMFSVKNICLNDCCTFFDNSCWGLYIPALLLTVGMLAPACPLICPICCASYHRKSRDPKIGGEMLHYVTHEQTQQKKQIWPVITSDVNTCLCCYCCCVWSDEETCCCAYPWCCSENWRGCCGPCKQHLCC